MSVLSHFREKADAIHTTGIESKIAPRSMYDVSGFCAGPAAKVRIEGGYDMTAYMGRLLLQNK